MPTRSLNGAELSYAEAGSGPPLLLLHGQLCDQRFWWAQVSALAEAFHVIAPSLRHYWPDTCDADSTTFTTRQHASDIAALIDDLGEGPVHLCGHSRGGYVAFRVAQQFPQAVRTLILAEPGGPIDISGKSADEIPPPAPTPIDAIMPAVLDHLRSDEIDPALELFFDTIQAKGAWRAAPEPFREMARANAMTLVAQERFEPQRRPICLDEIVSVAAPTLLIGGALSPPPFPGTLALLERTLPNAARVEIAGASHAMNAQNPAAFNEAITHFLRSHMD